MRAYKRIKELAKITDEIAENGSVVADIACDHGYLAELFDRNPKFSAVFATDISPKCLEKVQKIKRECGLDKIETLLGDGLEPLGRVDVAVIAGVGGLEISKMLTNQNKLPNGARKCDKFVLQPAQNAYELRKWLFENEFFVIKDYIFEDAKKFYPIIAIDVSKKQKNEASLFNLYFGRDNDVSLKAFQNFLRVASNNFAYLDGIDKRQIAGDKALIEKFEIYNLVKKYLIK